MTTRSHEDAGRIAFAVHPDLAPALRAGVLAFGGVLVRARDEALDAALLDAEAGLCAASGQAGTVAAVRTLYARVGLDPTRTRPSSEALLRRLRKGNRLPAVNTVVDVGNWCSAETQLPFGLYDLDRLEGPLELRLGRPAEEYPGIRKEVVHVGGRITLADANGPFGNPTSDSARTMVTGETRRVLVVIFAPRQLGEAPVLRALDLTSGRLARYAGGHEIEQLTI